MKKFIAFIMVLASVCVILVGCSEADNIFWRLARDRDLRQL